MTVALVTGAAGFIGSHLTRRLLGEGVETVCLVRSEASVQKLPDGAKAIRTTGSDAASVAEALGGVQPELVFHLAASGVFGGNETQQQTILENVALTTSLVTAAADWPLRCFFHTGTYSEYQDCGNKILSEDSPLVAESVYGASKSAAYICGRALASAYGVPFVNLRLFAVYGAGEAPRRLLPYLATQLSAGEPAALSPGDQQRDLVYVEDVVEAMWVAANTPEIAAAPAYNVCTGKPTTVKQVGQMLAEKLKAPPELLQWGARPHRDTEPMKAIGDNSLLYQTTGWSPRIMPEEGVSRFVEWWLTTR